MNIVTGLFQPDKLAPAIRQLTQNGFQLDHLSIVTSAAHVPAFMEGEPETSAVSGAAVGGAVGGAAGALGSWAVASIPGMESLLAAGMLTTAAGGVIGGYLGSLYGVRAESQTELDVHEAVADGEILLIVQTDETAVDTAVTLMESSHGRHVEAHTVASEGAAQ